MFNRAMIDADDNSYFQILIHQRDHSQGYVNNRDINSSDDEVQEDSLSEESTKETKLLKSQAKTPNIEGKNSSTFLCRDLVKLLDKHLKLHKKSKLEDKLTSFKNYSLIFGHIFKIRSYKRLQAFLFYNPNNDYHKFLKVEINKLLEKTVTDEELKGLSEQMRTFIVEREDQLKNMTQGILADGKRKDKSYTKRVESFLKDLKNVKMTTYADRAEKQQKSSEDAKNEHLQVHLSKSNNISQYGCQIWMNELLAGDDLVDLSTY